MVWMLALAACLGSASVKIGADSGSPATAGAGPAGNATGPGGSGAETGSGGAGTGSGTGGAGTATATGGTATGTPVDTSDTATTPPTDTGPPTPGPRPQIVDVSIQQPDRPDWILGFQATVEGTADVVTFAIPHLGLAEERLVIDGQATVLVPIDPCWVPEEAQILGSELAVEVRAFDTTWGRQDDWAADAKVWGRHSFDYSDLELGDTPDDMSSFGGIPVLGDGPGVLCADVHSTGHTAWIIGDLDWYAWAHANLDEESPVRFDLDWTNPATDLDLTITDWFTVPLGASERRSGTHETVTLEDTNARDGYRLWVGGWDGPVDEYILTGRHVEE